MPQVVRIGDANQVGGLVIDGEATVFVNGRPIGIHTSRITPHPCCGNDGCSAHCNATTTTGSSTVFAGGRPVLYVGVSDTCGHSRVQGSADVFVGT